MVTSREVKDSSQKSSIISCLPGTNVRQKKISSPKDRPLKVGNKSKTSRSNVVLPKNYLAWYVARKAQPSQEKLSIAKPSQEKLSTIARIEWKCPPKFILNVDWCVAAGEESKEVEAQKYRESTVCEVIYPRPSLIPQSPFASVDLEGENRADSLTPIVPTEEEAELPLDISADSAAPAKTVNPLVTDDSYLSILHGLENGNLAVAATVATAVAVLENKERIDTELLIKLLTHPEMLKGIGDSPGAPKAVPASAAVPSASQVRNANLCTSTVAQNLSAFLKPNFEVPSSSNLTNGPGQPVHSHLNQIHWTNQVKPVTRCATQSNQQSFPKKVSNQGIPLVASLKLPVSSHPSVQVINKAINEYGSPYVVATNQVALPIPSTSDRPNGEEMQKMVNQYGLPQNIRPNFTSGSLCLNPEMAVTFPPNLMSTGVFNSLPFPPVTSATPPVKDSNYFKSLIKQHGQNHENRHRPQLFGHSNSNLPGQELGQNAKPVELNSQFENPCMYSNTDRGWPHGSYQHNVPGHWRPRVEENPFAKGIKFNDNMGRF